MLWAHLGEGGTENPLIEVEVDFSLEAEVPALPRKGQSHKNVTGFFFYAKMFHNEKVGVLHLKLQRNFM